MCAGPYSLRLLGITPPIASDLQSELARSVEHEILRPGYVRITLPYFASPAAVKYILDAVLFVARHGWKLLPQYSFDARASEWVHLQQRKPTRGWLGGVSYASGEMRTQPQQKVIAAEADPKAYADWLAQAEAVVGVAASEFRFNGGSAQPKLAAKELTPEAARLRWFMLPAEAASLMQGKEPAAVSPFMPLSATLSTTLSATLSAKEQSAKKSTITDGDGRGDAASAAGETASEESSAASAESTDDDTLEAFEAFADAATHQADEACKAPVSETLTTRSPRLSLWTTPPPKIYNSVTRAILQFGMLREGDRVLLGLSGGKDSLSLLHILHALQQRTPFKWSLAACTVDPMADGFDPSPLKGYLAALGVPYYYAKEDLIGRAPGCMGKEGNRVSICSFCSRFDRAPSQLPPSPDPTHTLRPTLPPPYPHPTPILPQPYPHPIPTLPPPYPHPTPTLPPP